MLKANNENLSGSNTKWFKSKKGLIIVITSVIIIVGIVTMFIILSQKLDETEKKIYDVVYKYQSEFKNPSSVKISKAKLCGTSYGEIDINATNGLGGIVSSTYYLEDSTLFERDDSKDKTKDIVQKCFDLEYEASNNIQYLSQDSINKINKLLGKRYK